MSLGTLKRKVKTNSANHFIRTKRVKEDEPKANQTCIEPSHTLPSLRKEKSTSCISKSTSKKHYSMPNNFELCSACKIDGLTIFKEQTQTKSIQKKRQEQSIVTHYKDPKATNSLVSLRPPKNTEKLRIDVRSRSRKFSFILHKQN